MNTDTVLIVLTSVVIAVLLVWIYGRNRESEIKLQIAENRDLEKKLHLREREFLDEKNQIEISKTDALRVSRAAGFEEGRALGQAEGQRDHLTELTKLRAEFMQQLARQCGVAASDARERLRAEYELQTKLFTVKIGPYVKISEDKSLFNKKHEAIAGYQYQLLINGIPAFSPHIVQERVEIKSEINPELERAFLAVAEKAADAAIGLYLGGNIQFARRAPAVIDHVTK